MISISIHGFSFNNVGNAGSIAPGFAMKLQLKAKVASKE